MNILQYKIDNLKYR